MPAATMLTCRSCHAELDRAVPECPYCGADLVAQLQTQLSKGRRRSSVAIVALAALLLFFAGWWSLLQFQANEEVPILPMPPERSAPVAESAPRPVREDLADRVNELTFSLARLQTELDEARGENLRLRESLDAAMLAVEMGGPKSGSVYFASEPDVERRGPDVVVSGSVGNRANRPAVARVTVELHSNGQIVGSETDKIVVPPGAAADYHARFVKVSRLPELTARVQVAG